MKWAEVITVRSVGSRAEMMAATLRELVTEVVRDLGRGAIRVFHREKLDSDICVVLLHDGEKAKTGGSPLGLRLENALNEFGIVHHVVWIEMGREPGSTVAEDDPAEMRHRTPYRGQKSR